MWSVSGCAQVTAVLLSRPTRLKKRIWSVVKQQLNKVLLILLLWWLYQLDQSHCGPLTLITNFITWSAPLSYRGRQLTSPTILQRSSAYEPHYLTEVVSLPAPLSYRDRQLTSPTILQRSSLYQPRYLDAMVSWPDLLVKWLDQLSSSA